MTRQTMKGYIFVKHTSVQRGHDSEARHSDDPSLGSQTLWIFKVCLSTDIYIVAGCPNLAALEEAGAGATRIRNYF